MTSLEDQIRDQMHAAFKSLITETFCKSCLDEKDVIWVERLLLELRDRINGLTPSRHDLHVSLKATFDVQLITQMLRRGAADSNDLTHVAHVVIERLGMLCAPVQDESVATLKSLIMHAEDVNACLAALLYESNVIIDEIERLNSNVSSV